MFGWLLGRKKIIIYICLTIIGFFIGYDYVMLNNKTPQEDRTEVVNLEKKYELLEAVPSNQPDMAQLEEDFPEDEAGIPEEEAGFTEEETMGFDDFGSGFTENDPGFAEEDSDIPAGESGFNQEESEYLPGNN